MGDVKMLRQFDLQLFSEEKTEKATPKKRRDAREKGQVVQSKDIGSALILIVVIVTINFTAENSSESVVEYFNMIMSFADSTDTLSNQNLTYLLYLTIVRLVTIIAPILLGAMVIGVITAYMQVGFLFTTKTLAFKFDKINPINGFKRLFSLKSIVELLKALAKGGILIYICYDYIVDRIPLYISSFDMEITEFTILMWSTIYDIVIRCALVLFVIGILDYIYKRWQNEKDLRMSKQEIKDEYKQMEGDPKLKAKIKERQRSMAMSRMMADVPEADVIITNPTHFAVGVKYDRNVIGGSPQVVAKGKDLIAQNIKKVAGENDVPIVENKPLARALYSTVDLGEYIPPDLFEAVAEVLAYVYSLKK